MMRGREVLSDQCPRDHRKNGKQYTAEQCRGEAGIGRQMQCLDSISGDVEQQVVGAVGDNRDAETEE